MTRWSSGGGGCLLRGGRGRFWEPISHLRGAATAWTASRAAGRRRRTERSGAAEGKQTPEKLGFVRAGWARVAVDSDLSPRRGREEQQRRSGIWRRRAEPETNPKSLSSYYNGTGMETETGLGWTQDNPSSSCGPLCLLAPPNLQYSNVSTIHIKAKLVFGFYFIF